MAKLKIEGVWTGLLEVDLEALTVFLLREEVAKKSNCNPNSINLICDGKILTDDDGQHKLTQLGIKNNAKILVTHICAEQGKVIKQEITAEEKRCAEQGKVIKQEITAEEKRSHRLTRFKSAAIALGKRHADDSSPLEDLNIQVQDQSRRNGMLDSETDQRAIMMGLMLDINAKRLIREQNYKDALQMLRMAEEAFSRCDPEAIEVIENIPILHINMVWCYFMIQDRNSVPEARRRLEMAREGLERANENNSLCLRRLHKASYAELVLRLRLELLEGVVAYCSGRYDRAKETLIGAKAKFEQLQVSDESLSHVTSMGFAECDAKRALKICNQDVNNAVDFLLVDKEIKEQKDMEDLQRRNEIWEQKLYGMKPLQTPVDMQTLKDLVSLGFDKEVAAEALRINENDIQKSLDNLTNPQTTSALQSKKRKREQLERDSEIENFVQMGFERSRVIDAFEAGGTAHEAFEILVAEPNMEAEANSSATPSGGASSSSSLPHNAGVGDVQGSSHLINAPDVEMESELFADITDAEYDIQVNIVGEAIAKYLSLVESKLRESKGKAKLVEEEEEEKKEEEEEEGDDDVDVDE